MGGKLGRVTIRVAYSYVPRRGAQTIVELLLCKIYHVIAHLSLQRQNHPVTKIWNTYSDVEFNGGSDSAVYFNQIPKIGEVIAGQSPNQYVVELLILRSPRQHDMR
jgi:hypothetical protein